MLLYAPVPLRLYKCGIDQVLSGSCIDSEDHCLHDCLFRSSCQLDYICTAEEQYDILIGPPPVSVRRITHQMRLSDRFHFFQFVVRL